MLRAALKASIIQIMEGEEEQGEFTLIKISGKTVARVNVIGAIVAKDEDGQTALIDDGTGTIRVRTFGEEQKPIVNLEIGDIVNIIGRVRSYSGERYVSVEIIKKTTAAYKKLRELEIQLSNKNAPVQKTVAKAENIYEDALPEEDFSGAMKIRELIRELDSGKGADLMEITSKTDVPNPDTVIKNLLEMGEIFEVRPGKLKVLE
jgi:RPA family protein